jgi:hypothetical protein
MSEHNNPIQPGTSIRDALDWQAWRDNMDHATDVIADDLNAAIDEIIRLQEQVFAMERAQNRPDNAFWGQLMFDIALVVGFLWLFMRGC